MDKCLYYRKYTSNINGYYKDTVQWWSFHELNLDDILGEISLHLFSFRKSPRDIVLNGTLIHTYRISRKHIFDMITKFYNNNQFLRCKLYFDVYKNKYCNVLLYRGDFND